MGTYRDLRKHAEECVVKAQASEDSRDKALWLTLAQSWVQLAEHVANVASANGSAGAGEDALAMQSSD